MTIMTTTSAPFREADVARDVAGKFTGKDQSAPELTLSGEADFDLTGFMQEPPTTPTPFTVLQPVVYTDVDGDAVHGTVVSAETDGWLAIVERTPGTVFETDDAGDSYLVEARYVRDDLDASRDTILRHQRGIDAASGLATALADADDDEFEGVNLYEDSLRVRDQLKVDGRTDWASSYSDVYRRVDHALETLTRYDHFSNEALSWSYMEGNPDVPQPFSRLDSVTLPSGMNTVRGGIQAKMIEPYAQFAAISDGDIERLNGAVDSGLDLGRRKHAAEDAANDVDDRVDAIGVEGAERAFPAHISSLSQRKLLAYRKAVAAASDAFDALERHELLHGTHRVWGSLSRNPATEEATLIRAAAQAAILRHYQPETGLTDAQLNAISNVFDGAVAAHQKSAAA